MYEGFFAGDFVADSVGEEDGDCLGQEALETGLPDCTAVCLGGGVSVGFGMSDEMLREMMMSTDGESGMRGVVGMKGGARGRRTWGENGIIEG